MNASDHMAINENSILHDNIYLTSLHQGSSFYRERHFNTGSCINIIQVSILRIQILNDHDNAGLR